MITRSIERHLVKTDAGYVHVRTLGGPVDGKPEVLLLHQVPASGRIWITVMEQMEGIATIAPDSLNLGESDGTAEALTLEEQAEYLWQATQQVRPGPKIVVGHHTGAALAAVLAATHADEILGTVLIGYPYYSSWKERLAKYERLNPAGTQADGSGVAAIWQFVDRAFHPDSDRDLVFDAFADRIRAGRIWYEGYVALWNADLTGLAGNVKRHPGPALLIAPERDILTAKAGTCAQLLGAELMSTTGGAFVLTEDPALVGSILTDFYTKALG